MEKFREFFHEHPERQRQVVWIVVFLFGLFLYIILITPPAHYPVGKVLTVEQGTGLYTLSNELQKEQIIRSPLWFRLAVITLGGEHDLKSGDYNLNRPENVFTIAYRIVNAQHKIDSIRITIPEGFTDAQISNLFDPKFQKFDHQAFLNLAKQGYMFPDTYFIETSATATSTIALLEGNFHAKVDPLTSQIRASGRTEDQVIILASILEAEVKSDADRKIVAAILLRRLKMSMALQVDSAPETYDFLGLPKAPVNNPGLGSITDALHPATSTPYLYFLTDKVGNVHYAKTFDEHKQNEAKYLGK